MFEDVHISHSGGRLVVTVVEAPVINQVAFEGNKKAKDEQLKSEVQSKPRGTLVEGRPCRPTCSASSRSISAAAASTSRVDPQDHRTAEQPGQPGVRDQGRRQDRRQGDQFRRRARFSSGRLKNVIKTTESNWLSFLQTTDIYDPDRVEADRDLLRRFYLQHGYADVRIVSATGDIRSGQERLHRHLHHR